MEHAIIQPKFLPCKYIYCREIGWKGKREYLIEMQVPCRVAGTLKALLTLQARCNLITAGFSISVLRLRSLLQESDWSCRSEASYCTLLVSFCGKMQVYGTVMSACANVNLWCLLSLCFNAGLWYRNVRSAIAGLWYRNVPMSHCRVMIP